MPTSTLLRLFAKSPLKPLQEHANKVQACCKQLVPFFEAVFSDQWKLAQQLRQKIILREQQANVLKREIRLKLPSGLFLPVNRTDMLELLSQEDGLANKTKDISGLVLGRKLTLPDALRAPFMQYLARCLDATDQAKQLINELDELLTTGFRGKEVAFVEEMVTKLDAIEDDTDQQQIALRGELHKLEPQMSAVDVLFIYKIFDWVGDLADQALRVGNRLEMMLARS